MELAVPISNSNSGVTWCADALQAVKLDPAVLDAHISMTKDVDRQLDASCANSGAEYPLKTMKSPSEESLKASQFEKMMRMQKAALLTLSPQQFELLLKYAEILRLQRLHNQKHLECAFCKNNGEPASWYSLHMLKDNRGRVRCPVLRGHRCPRCGATGDWAHTVKYCPENSDGDRWSC